MQVAFLAEHDVVDRYPRIARYKVSEYIEDRKYYSNSFTFCPLLVLKPDAKVISGDGTADSPYVLGE